MARTEQEIRDFYKDAHTEQEIRDFHKDAHDEITRQYYSDKSGFPGGPVAFQAAHALIWRNMEADLIAEGYQDPPVAEPESIDSKLDKIIQRLDKLEGKNQLE